MGKSQKKSTKDNSYKLERTAANKKVRMARQNRRTGTPEQKSAKLRRRRLAQAATIKKYGVKTWREVQAKRAYATSFDSSVEVIKTDKAPTRNSAEALVNVLTGKVA